MGSPCRPPAPFGEGDPPRFRRRVWGAAILINLLTVVAIVVQLSHSWGQERRHADAVIEGISGALGQALQATVEKLDLALLAAQDGIERGNGTPEAVQALLRRIGERYPDAGMVHVFDPGGRPVGSPPQAAPYAPAIGGRDYFQRLRDDPHAGLVVSGMVRQGGGPWDLILARRLSDSAGSFRGLVLIPVPASDLEPLIARVDVGRDGSVAVFGDMPGVLIRHPGPVEAAASVVLSPEVRGLVRAGVESAFYQARSGVDGVERRFHFRRVGPFPLYLTVGVAGADYLAGWWRDLVRAGTFVVAIGLSSAMIAWLLIARREDGARASHRIQGQEERFRAIADHSPCWEDWITVDGRLLWVNPAVHDLTGRSVADCMAMPDYPLPILHPDDHDPWKGIAEAVASGVRSGSLEIRLRHSDGRMRWAELTWRAVLGDDGRPAGWRGATRDVTDRKTESRSLEASEARYRALFDDMLTAVALFEVVAGADGRPADFRFHTVNRAFLGLLERRAEDFLGRSVREALPALATDRTDWGGLLAQVAATGQPMNFQGYSEVFGRWMDAVVSRPAPGQVAVLLADISHVKEYEARLDQLAHHDSLTGLPNRLTLSLRLQRAIERGRHDRSAGAVLILDIDHFKTVNDSIGTTAGDELLRMVARRYANRLRDSDTLARLGGDEFAVLLERLRTPQDAAVVAQSLIDALRDPFQLAGGRDVFVGASVGISVFPDDGGVAEQLIGKADAALHQAKGAGRNSCRFYTESMTAAASARVELEVALRHGLSRQEFLLHYQPLVALADGRITGVEALVRWQRPGHGLIPPVRFIGLAEETGLIIPLGADILADACRQMSGWRNAGLPLDTLAVNLSARQIQRPDLPDQVRAILDETGLPAGTLELEITESVLMEFGGEVERRLWALKDLGVRLAIDDFGTGYSSLAYLKRFPIDTLKVDQSFVRDIPGDSADMEIVGAIVGLARTLNLEVVAEGIETEGQLEFLRGLGCRTGQGYLFSRPRPAAEIGRLLAAVGDYGVRVAGA
ncbi:MAG: EAL domain-containing protein [Telmatospirillum sp.]|nr:EAL domain-containing protein [Telmatospirillum sp.]